MDFSEIILFLHVVCISYLDYIGVQIRVHKKSWEIGIYNVSFHIGR